MTSHPSDTTPGADTPAPGPARTPEQELYDSLPPLVPVPLAIKVLGLPRSSVYKYAARGHLEAQRLGTRVYIVKIAIRKWLDGQATPTDQPGPAAGPGSGSAGEAAA